MKIWKRECDFTLYIPIFFRKWQHVACTLKYFTYIVHILQGSVLDVHVLPNDTTLTILRQEFHWTRTLDDDSSSESDSQSECEPNSKSDSSESNPGPDSESTSTDEAVIRPNHHQGVVQWLKRLFTWWQDYHQDFWS